MWFHFNRRPQGAVPSSGFGLPGSALPFSASQFNSLQVCFANYLPFCSSLPHSVLRRRLQFPIRRRGMRWLRGLTVATAAYIKKYEPSKNADGLMSFHKQTGGGVRQAIALTITLRLA